MSEFEKYIAGENSVWGKRRNNQGGRQLEPTEIAEMLNELEREREAATKRAEQAEARELAQLRGGTFPISTHNGLHIYSDADAVERAMISLEAKLSEAIEDAGSLANFIDYHCVEDLPDALTREIVRKYIDPAQPALPLAFSECPECGMTHAPGENTLCSQ